jgi:hypothetical protein
VNARLPACLAAALTALLAVAPGAGAGGPVVLFDEGHGQRFLVGGTGPLDLSRLAAVVRARGADVRATRGALTPDSLNGAQSLLISGAFEALKPGEVEAVVGFVDAGGTLGVMIHVESPQADLLHRLDVSISNGVIREQQGVVGADPLNFRVTRLKPHALTKGLASITMYGVWALLPTSPSAEVIAETGPKAWVDLNRNGKLDARDALQSFAVAVAGRHGKGFFAAFGDDALFQNRFLTAGNRRLAENLADWLLGKVPVSTPPARSHA